MSLAPAPKLGRYEIRSKIGEGGMGEVYLAEDTRLHRKLALKILPVELAANKDRMRRFEQETRRLARRQAARAFARHADEQCDLDSRFQIARINCPGESECVLC